MRRFATASILAIALASVVLVSDVSLAEDGDVAYSSPYITVDPETGELITVNPGPHLKAHQNPAASASDVQPDGDARDPKQHDGSFFTILLAGGGVFVLVALVVTVRRRTKQNANGPTLEDS